MWLAHTPVDQCTLIKAGLRGYGNHYVHWGRAIISQPTSKG